MITIIDFGGQYTLLIAKVIRKLQVYCEIINPNQDISPQTQGVILSGSPKSASTNEIDISKFKVPVLGICYGAQLIAKWKGCDIKKQDAEYGKCKINVIAKDNLLRGTNRSTNVWMSHSDTIQCKSNTKIIPLAVTQNRNLAAFKVDPDIYGVQFHPEVSHTPCGTIILDNFVKICKCEKTWQPANFIEEQIKKVKDTVKTDNVVMAISGGVDSTIAASIIQKAIGKQLHCVYIDTGFQRPQDTKVMKYLEEMFTNVKRVDASGVFLSKLNEIQDPEQKRKLIGELFIETFQKEAEKIENVKFLGQGTIYSDVIESMGIKSHHNVGGLPKDMKLELIEPIRHLFKDEVRKVGTTLGIHQSIINRHPFPGPGLAIRILGPITTEKVLILQKADDILYKLLLKHNFYDKIWQAGIVLFSQKTVGVVGDKRQYSYCVGIRAVNSTDAMTAKFFPFSMEFLEIVSTEITNKIPEINRVLYDVTNKPPATIEFE
jgi:GMP synthase (glutamine-hydrolysing)